MSKAVTLTLPAPAELRRLLKVHPAPWRRDGGTIFDRDGRRFFWPSAYINDGIDPQTILGDLLVAVVNEFAISLPP